MAALGNHAVARPPRKPRSGLRAPQARFRVQAGLDARHAPFSI